VKINKIIGEVSAYLDEIIGKFDYEKVLTLFPRQNQGSMTDNSISLERYQNFFKNTNFSEFNFMNDIKNRTEDTLLNIELSPQEIDELMLIKCSCERVLLKFINIIYDLVDCKLLHERIIMEGLNGFLQIENEDLVLYSVHRFMARDGNNAVYKGIYSVNMLLQR